MFYDVRWYKEPVLLYVRHEGVLTPDKIVRAEETVLSFLHDTRHRVHIMIDVTRMTGVDCNLHDIEKLDIVQRVGTHPRKGWLVCFDRKNPAYAFMATVVGQRLRENVQIVDSETEAVDFLRRIDSRLVYLTQRNFSYS